MSARRLLTLVPSVVLLVAVAVPASAAPEAKPLDTAYIGNDTAIVLVLHPQRMLQRTAKIPAFANEAIDDFKQYSGVDPKNLQQIILQFGTETKREERRGGFDEDALTFVFRFDKPIAPDTIAATGFQGNTKTTYKGQTYYKPDSERQPALWFPNNRTMIVANEWRVLDVIDEPYSMGSMVSRLRQVDNSADLLVEVDVRRAQPLLNEMFRSFPAEEPFALAQTIEKLIRVTLTVSPSSDTPLDMQLVAKSAENARELQTQGQALLTLARGAWSRQRDLFREQAPDEAGEMVESIVETIDTILAGTKFSTDRERVLVRVEAGDGSVDLFTLLAGMMLTGGGAANVEAEAVDVEEAVRDAAERAEEERTVIEKAARQELEERRRTDKQEQDRQ